MKNKPEKSEEEALKEMAPVLFSLKRENPFEVPPGYFESLPDLIMAKLPQKRRFWIFSGRFMPFSLFSFETRIFRPLLAGVSVFICLGIAALYFWNRGSSQPEPQFTLDTFISSGILEQIDETLIYESFQVCDQCDPFEAKETNPGEGEIQDLLIEEEVEELLNQEVL